MDEKNIKAITEIIDDNMYSLRESLSRDSDKCRLDDLNKYYTKLFRLYQEQTMLALQHDKKATKALERNCGTFSLIDRIIAYVKGVSLYKSNPLRPTVIRHIKGVSNYKDELNKQEIEDLILIIRDNINDNVAIQANPGFTVSIHKEVKYPNEDTGLFYTIGSYVGQDSN